MVQNMEKINFRKFFTVTSQQWSLYWSKTDCWVSWNISDQIHRIRCPKLLYFLRKCTKSSKIRPRGAVPLKSEKSFVILTSLLGLKINPGNLESRERIFLEKCSLGKIWRNFGPRELEFWPKHRWKCTNFLKIENGGHTSGSLRVNW